MTPTVAQGRVDQLLTNVSIAYLNRSYIADAILPVVPNLVDETGKIGSVSNDHLRIYNSKRSLYDTAVRRLEFSYTQDKSYSIDFFDLDGYVPDRLVSQVKSPFDVRRDMTLVTQQSLMLEREYALGTALASTAIMTNNVTLSGTDQWSDYVNSQPEVDIQTAMDAVFAATGLEANTFVMSREVLMKLKYHPFFLSQVRGVRVPSDTDVITILKDFFGFKQVLVGTARYNSAKEGQTETLAAVWGKNAQVLYVPEVPSLMNKAFGYSFQIAGKNYVVRRRREPQADKGDLINVEHARDDHILNATAGYLIKSCVA